MENNWDLLADLFRNIRGTLKPATKPTKPSNAEVLSDKQLDDCAEALMKEMETVEHVGQTDSDDST
jgi:hypothetical protein